jgi:hypothetical protein
MFSLAFSFAIRTEGWSMSVPTATLDPVLAAAMASTPVPEECLDALPFLRLLLPTPGRFREKRRMFRERFATITGEVVHPVEFAQQHPAE